ncbi:MAG: hypothetical protein FJY55_15605 [Betaproteobacteria bacterium]|nr:hypothetical protein [Betaproteobacteria bacterium]
MARKAVFASSNWPQTVLNIAAGHPPGTVTVDAPAGVGAGWTYDGSSFSAPAQAGPRIWTPLQFQARLVTADEWGGVIAGARASDALFNWMMQFVAAQEINLDDPRTIAGLGALVTAGLLTSARKDRILSGLPPE